MNAGGAMAGVLVDTSVWIDFLRRTDGETGDEFTRLLKGRRVVLCGVVEAELLHGLDQAQERHLRPWLDMLDYADTLRDDWRSAGELLAGQRHRGKPIPLTDALIAALALRLDMPVFTLDRHFTAIPGLQLHSLR